MSAIKQPTYPVGIGWFLIALLAATLIAAIPTSSAYLAAGSGGAKLWLNYYSYIGPYYYLWALISPVIYWLALGPLHPKRNLLAAVFGHALTFVSLNAVWGFFVHNDNWRHWLFGDNAPGFYIMGASSYVAILLGIYMYQLQRRLHQQQLRIGVQHARELSLKASLALAEIDSLRGQMNPHFLFNALNCIGALIETQKNHQAYKALEDLGQLLRTSLRHGEQGSVTLRSELDFAERYVAMERMRFGDRIKFTLYLAPDLGEWQVPPFILQPLIENVIKHAVAPSSTAVDILIDARRKGSDLQLMVANSGPAFKQPLHGVPSLGIGLGNLRQRLDLIYAGRSCLKFQQLEASTRVLLIIPVQAA